MHRQIRPGDQEEASRIYDALTELAQSGFTPGVASEATREVLVVQLIESLRRNRYIDYLRERTHSHRVLEFDREKFDPIMGALFRWRQGDTEDAFWLVFLSVHFGRHRSSRWALCCNFYNRLGDGSWNWVTASADLLGVRSWLDENVQELKAGGARFGNHRKYETLRGIGPNGTGETIETYVQWVGESHAIRFAPDNASGDLQFTTLFRSMASVNRVGRTARFDYLSMLGKLGFVEFEPDAAYLSGATGPLRGARLLLSGSPVAGTAPAQLEKDLQKVKDALGLSYDVIEDALCNWQKSPRHFIAFRG